MSLCVTEAPLGKEINARIRHFRDLLPDGTKVTMKALGRRAERGAWVTCSRYRGGRDCVQIDISTRHGHLSEASRQKIEAKVMKITRIFDRLTSIHLTVDLEHAQMPSVDLRVSAEHKHDFVSNDRGTDLMGSIDGVVHRMESQIRKYKEKIQHKNRTDSRKDNFSETVTENPEDKKE